MSIDATTYTITIQKICIDGEDLFESTIKELPDVNDYAETYNEAYELALDTIKTTAEMLEEEGRQIPKPFEKHDVYSGRVTLRLPKSLHKEISNLSEIDGVSLNGYVVSILSEKVGMESLSTMYKAISYSTNMLAISVNTFSGNHGERPILKVGLGSNYVSTTDSKEQVIKYG